RAAVEASERVAEGISSPDILAPAYRAAWDVLPLRPYSGVHVSAARAAGRTVQDQAYDAAILAKNEVVELHAQMEEEKVTTEDEQYRVYWIGKAQGQTILASCLRDIFGNPFCPVAPDPTWKRQNAIILAQTMYDSRDFTMMPLLADLLEEAG